MNAFWVRSRERAERATGISLLLVAFVALAICYSLIIPLFEGPDEDDHFRYAKFIADHRALPVQEFMAGGGEAGHQGWQPPLYYSLVALLISPLDTTDHAQHLWRNTGWAALGDPSCCGRNIYYHTESEAFPFTRTTLAVHLARLLAVCFGAVTVWGTYALVKTLASAQQAFPGWSADHLARLAPLAAAAVVAFNPSFLFASALVSNDTLLAALSALVLLMWVRLLFGEQSPNLAAAMQLGVLIGLAVLTKTTALGLIPFSVAAFGIAAWRRGDYRLAVIGNALVLGIIAVWSGWWLVRNQILYGDPLAYRLMTVSAIFERSGPLTVAELFQISLPWMWQTLWGGPTPGDFSPALLAVLCLFTLLGCLGVIVFVVRYSKIANRDSRFAAITTLALLAAWLGAILVGQIQFVRMTVGADQGRYLFPAISVIGLIWALGLGTLATKLRLDRSLLAVMVVAFLLLALFVPIAYTLPAYAPPALLSSEQAARAQHTVDMGFADQIELLGYDLDTRAVKPGETLGLALYWRALAPMSEPYRVFVHLIGQNDSSAGGVDVIPARGAFPTVYWRPGDTLRDMVSIPVAPNAPPGKYSIEIGLYPVGKPGERLKVNESRDDSFRVDAIKVSPREPLVYAPKVRTDMLFGNKIRLLGYDAAADSNILTITLYWQGLTKSKDDYTVFVHALDANGDIIAQQDQEPQAGNYPTSLWDVGEQVRDQYVLSLPQGVRDYRVEIGFYRAGSGERLPVQGGDSLVLDRLENVGR